MQLPQWLTSTSTLANIAASISLVAVVFLVRFGLIRWIRSRDWLGDEAQLGWRVRLNNVSWLVMLLSIMSIWSSQIETLALSAVAIAAAIVVATKELILCVSGGVLRTASRAFSVGDRIEVVGIRGEVIDLGFFTTTILEIGAGNQRSGRAIVLPNALFMNQPVTNETYTQAYVLHLFTIPTKLDAHWHQKEALLLAAAREVCREHIEPARLHMNKLAEKHSLLVAQTEPRVIVNLTSPDSVTFAVRVPVPTREKNAIEQAILRKYLQNLAAQDLVPDKTKS